MNRIEDKRLKKNIRHEDEGVSHETPILLCFTHGLWMPFDGIPAPNVSHSSLRLSALRWHEPDSVTAQPADHSGSLGGGHIVMFDSGNSTRPTFVAATTYGCLLHNEMLHDDARTTVLVATSKRRSTRPAPHRVGRDFLMGELRDRMAKCPIGGSCAATRTADGTCRRRHPSKITIGVPAICLYHRVTVSTPNFRRAAVRS